MAKVYANRVWMTTGTTGTGTITLGSAKAGYATFAEGGVANADTVTYVIIDGNDFEIGTGTYTSSGTTMSRDTVHASKISGTAGTSKINLSGSAEVFLSSKASEVAFLDRAQAFTTAQQFTTIELGAASDTTISRSSAGVIAVEGVNLARVSDLVGQQTIWVPAGAMTSRTTNGAATGSVETTTNKVMLKTLDFDTTTQEFAQFAIQMPKGWNESTLVCQFVWSHPSTTTNFGVVWAIEAVAFANDDAADTAFGTAVQVADTGGTTNDIYITDETSAVTVAGSPGAEEWVVFQVKRVPADGSDTLAVDARLHGVKIHYTTDSLTDS